MRYEKEIIISNNVAGLINHYLHDEPKCAADCLGEDETIVYTAVFDDGIEIDVKCCGVQYHEDEETNTAWCEAVMFKNGCEVCCEYGEDDFFGEWEMEHNGNKYVVFVEVATY